MMHRIPTTDTASCIPLRVSQKRTTQSMLYSAEINAISRSIISRSIISRSIISRSIISGSTISRSIIWQSMVFFVNLIQAFINQKNYRNSPATREKTGP